MDYLTFDESIVYTDKIHINLCYVQQILIKGTDSWHNVLNKMSWIILVYGVDQI